ncbi:MAG: hypothetical protein R3D46_15025 [Defluviimonas denitrificans]
MAEALAIGQRLGERVLVIATSTGGTLAAEAAVQPDLAAQMDGIVFVSPNFGLRGGLGTVLSPGPMPGSGRLGRGAGAVFYARDCGARDVLDHLLSDRGPDPDGGGGAPCGGGGLFRRHAACAVPLFRRRHGRLTRRDGARVAAGWGGPVAVEKVTVGPGDDPYSHVIAGDTLSPSMTAPVAARVLDWAKGL